MAQTWTQISGISDEELSEQLERVALAKQLAARGPVTAGLDPEEALLTYPDAMVQSDVIEPDAYRAGTWFYYTEGQVSVRQGGEIIAVGRR